MSVDITHVFLVILNNTRAFYLDGVVASISREKGGGRREEVGRRMEEGGGRQDTREEKTQVTRQGTRHKTQMTRVRRCL